MPGRPHSGRYALGGWPLASGATLRDARLGYRIWGQPNATRDNFIVLPTYYTGAHDDYAPLVGADAVFDSDRFCVVALDLFGNGVSSSPSRAAPGQRGSAFPRVTLADAVAAQHRFLTEALGMQGVALAAGWSLGGMQAYRWAAAYPGQVQRLLPWCAAARCAPQNYVFLDGLRAALTLDPVFAGGDYAVAPEAGLRAFGRIYCAWAYGPAFFDNAGWKALGFNHLEGLLRAWENEHCAWDANDLLCKLTSWQCADPGNGEDAALARWLAAIRARAILMPCTSDGYFRPEPNAREAEAMPHAEVRPVASDLGHVAGGPGRHPAFTRALAHAAATLLADYAPGEFRLHQ